MSNSYSFVRWKVLPRVSTWVVQRSLENSENESCNLSENHFFEVCACRAVIKTFEVMKPGFAKKCPCSFVKSPAKSQYIRCKKSGENNYRRHDDFLTSCSFALSISFCGETVNSESISGEMIRVEDLYVNKVNRSVKSDRYQVRLAYRCTESSIVLW